ncbi:MAG: hypothetical protein JSW41_02075 [Candidatus Aenigmatarchaeota archaeon]|nr:MAG: hypothetical protein JSW41_02075 [Candidatus Aenigmarchaeota archaeon]
MWVLLIGLLMIGLVAMPFAMIAGEVIPLFSDPASQIVIFAALPIFTILFVYVVLFSGGIE